MDRETRLELLKWLGTACTVAGTAVTLTPVVPKVASDPRLLVFFVSGLAIIALGGVIFWFRSQLDQPDFTVLDFKTILSMYDQTGARASLLRIQTQRTNRDLPPGKFFVARVSSDGPIKQIWLDKKEIVVANGSSEATQPPGNPQIAPATSALMRVERNATIWKNYESLSKGAVIKTELKLEFENAFCNSSEFLLTPIALQLKNFHVQINLHPARPCTNPRAVLTYYDHPHRALKNGLVVSDDGTRLSLEGKNPKLGIQYRVDWDW